MGAIDPNSNTPNTNTTPTNNTGTQTTTTTSAANNASFTDSLSTLDASGSISSVPLDILSLSAIRIAIKNIETSIRNNTKKDFGALSKNVLEGFVNSLSGLIQNYTASTENADKVNAEREKIISETNPAILNNNRTQLNEEQTRRQAKNAEDPPPKPLLPLLNLTDLYSQIEDADPATANAKLAAFLQDANLTNLGIPTNITLEAFKSPFQQYEIPPDAVDKNALTAAFVEAVNNTVNNTVDQLEEINEAAEASLEEEESGIKSLKERLNSKTSNATVNTTGISQSVHKNQTSVDASFRKTIADDLLAATLISLDQAEPIFSSLAKTFEDPAILEKFEALGIALSPGMIFELNTKTTADFLAFLKGSIFSSSKRLNDLQPPEGESPSNEAVALNNAIELLIQAQKGETFANIEKFIEAFIAKHPEFANLTAEQAATLGVILSSVMRENLLSAAAGAFASALGEPQLQPTLTQLLLANVLGISPSAFDQELFGAVEKLKARIGKSAQQILNQPENSESLQKNLLEIIKVLLFKKEALANDEEIENSKKAGKENKKEKGEVDPVNQEVNEVSNTIKEVLEAISSSKETITKEEVKKEVIADDIEKDALRQANLKADLLKTSSTQKDLIKKVLSEFKAALLFKNTEGAGLPAPELAFIENNQIFKDLILKENINKLERLKELRRKIRPNGLKEIDGSNLENLNRFVNHFNAATDKLKKAINNILGADVVSSLLAFNHVIKDSIFTNELDSLFNDILKEKGFSKKNLTPFERLITIFSQAEEKEKDITTIFAKAEFESKKADLSALFKKISPGKNDLAKKEQNTANGPMNLKTDPTGRNTGEELAVDIPILG